MSYRVLDLFSGIGGFSLGLERSGGFRTAAFCEISPKCRHLLNHHWPEVPTYEDVCSLTADQLAADGIEADAICGGFPCQDLSYAGKGAGLDGERSGLWREYARLIREVRPRRVFVENVSALLGRGMGRVLGDLATLGYDAWWDCIPAAAVGAPHLRDRLWIVAYPRGVEHEGYGDALRRAVAAELPRAYLRNTGLLGGPDGEADAFDPHANGFGPHRAQEHVEGSPELRDEQERQPGSLGKDVADAYGQRLEGIGANADPLGRQGPQLGSLGLRDRASHGPGRRQPEPHLGRMADGLPPGMDGMHGGWAEEPPIPRVAVGVPGRVDRLHGLGNAVVPEIPYRLAKAVLTADAEMLARRLAA